MIPLYRQILERLGEQLDPYVFQDCVCDLLRDVFPGLVPISGGRGGDRGMDGAIADGEGEAYPMVVTTGADLRGNLEASLDSYRRQGGTRDRVVFVTSRVVSPSERRKLEEAARGKGFILLQLFDRRAIADRLYRSSRWRRELLGLSGEPPALSALPPRPRPLLDIDLVGRENDLAWLRSTAGDRLLVGEPGSGKTFLLYQLAREGVGLFLVGGDWPAVANALRERQPQAVLVDDAHIDPERLVRLRHLGSEIGAGFDIVAAAWAGARERVADALGSPPVTHIRTLEGLTRNEIVEVYRRAGVNLPDEGMRELVDQAANNPGLAITLARAFLRGEYDPLIRGEALSQEVTRLVSRLVGQEATSVLAAFAIGGDAGMPMEVVAATLGLSIVQVRRIASDLAGAGILKEAAGDTLAIRPWQLRAALVAKAFFSDAPGFDLPWHGLAASAPRRDDLAHTLILAAGRGARVPEDILRQEVQRSKSRRVWRSLARLNTAQAEWVLEHYESDIQDVLGAALDRAPEAVLPRLLADAEGVPRSGWSPADRLGLLRAWLREAPPSRGTTEPMRRRHLTVRVATAYLSAGGRADIGVQALCAALSPRLESWSRDPGMGDRFRISLGDELPPSVLPEFRRLWDQAREALPTMSGPEWREIRTLLREWSEARIAGREQPVVRRARQEFAAQILRDLAKRFPGSPGLASELQKAADRLDTLDLDLGLKRDPVFELLFDDDALATDAQKAAREAEMEDLAARWSVFDPAETLAAFGALEAEARAYRSHLNFWQVPKFGALLAAAVDRPEAWLAAALESEQGFALAEAFLRRTAALRRPGWEEAFERCLSLDRLAWSATEVMLQLEYPPEHLLEAALTKAVELPQLVETLAVGGRIPADTSLRLLGHHDRRVAAAMAIGEWNAREHGQVRPELRSEWRSAILRAPTSDWTGAPPDQSVDYWLSAILASDPDLALDWLRARLDEPETLPSGLLMDETSSHSPFAVAVRALSTTQRLALLDGLRPQPGSNGFVEDLLTLTIGRDASLYRQLLEREHLAAYILAPLRGRPDAAWADLASLALGHGASAEAIVQMARSVPFTIVGSGVDYSQAWKVAFEALLSDPRPGIREIGRLGSEWAQERIREAEEEWKEVERAGF